MATLSERIEALRTRAAELSHETAAAYGEVYDVHICSGLDCALDDAVVHARRLTRSLEAAEGYARKGGL